MARRHPLSGTGAMAEWLGSGRAGAAKMMITESVMPSKVLVKVDWLKPFKLTPKPADAISAPRMLGKKADPPSRRRGHVQRLISEIRLVLVALGALGNNMESTGKKC